MENVQFWLTIIIEILTGLSIAIPLAIALVNNVKSLFKEKKWNELVKKTLEFMATAEQKYSDGADKKVLVMSMVKTAAEQIGYDFNAESEAKISDLIDSICDAAKVINTKVEEKK